MGFVCKNKLSEYDFTAAKLLIQILILNILSFLITYTEVLLNQNLAWQDLKINNYTIRWLKGKQDKMIIGYFAHDSSIIISNEFNNLIDFIYSQDKKSWLDLAQASKSCQFNKNSLSAFFAPNIDPSIESAPINKLFWRLMPWFISNNADFCYVDKYVDNP